MPKRVRTLPCISQWWKLAMINFPYQANTLLSRSSNPYWCHHSYTAGMPLPWGIWTMRENLRTILASMQIAWLSSKLSVCYVRSKSIAKREMWVTTKHMLSSWRITKRGNAAPTTFASAPITKPQIADTKANPNAIFVRNLSTKEKSAGGTSRIKGREEFPQTIRIEQAPTKRIKSILM